MRMPAFWVRHRVTADLVHTLTGVWVRERCRAIYPIDVQAELLLSSHYSTMRA